MLLEALRVDDVVGAERGDALPALGIAHGRGDPRARARAELDRRGADAAGRTVHEQALARLEQPLGEEGVVGGGEDLGQTAGRGPVEALGHPHDLTLVHGTQLGLAAAADDRHDAVAAREALRPRAEVDDLARELEARDVCRRAGRRGVLPLALHDVGAVQPRGADPHEHLARPGHGVGMLLHADFAVTDRRCTHGRSLRSERRGGRPQINSAGPSPRASPGPGRAAACALFALIGGMEHTPPWID